MICAVGVDAQGHKHVLGLREGATENAVVAKALLEDLVARGLDPTRRRLFVIDGAKALRTAIDAVFGGRHAGATLSQPQGQQRRRLPAQGPARAGQGDAAGRRSSWTRRRGWPSSSSTPPGWSGTSPARRRRFAKGLEELFTINRLGLPSKLRRCLGTTNLIDNGHSAARDRMRRVKHWQSGAMALRWTAAAFDAASKGFRRIMGHEHLWMLKAALDERDRDRSLAQQAVAG